VLCVTEKSPFNHCFVGSLYWSDGISLPNQLCVSGNTWQREIHYCCVVQTLHPVVTTSHTLQHHSLITC